MNKASETLPSTEASRSYTIALIGNPNVGKTSVFNRLTNLNAKTSNFTGTTVERRIGECQLNDRKARIVDLPGLFSLEANSPEERVAEAFLRGEREEKPDAVLIVIDATNLSRSLFVAGQTIDLGRPTVVAVNMVELSREQGLDIDFPKLEEKLRCKAVPISARTGEGFDELIAALEQLDKKPELEVLAEPLCTSCSTCPYAHGHKWAATLASEVSNTRVIPNAFTDPIDRVLTHKWIGPVMFALTMTLVFALVFWLATYPMDWLDAACGALASTVSGWLPEGDFNSLVTDGIIGAVGSVVVFLPQICILFFALTLLEDSGYLSRAVVVVDRLMQRVGLPGQAFVPLLTAHACAIPAIMSTRTVENRRDRLATIMVIPLMTCSARLPVYSMVAALLFPGNAFYAALVFVGSYVLGLVMAFLMALLFKWTILPGDPSPLILDLPAYRVPSFRNAALQAYRRGISFLRDAGTVILAISIAIWFLSTYPKLPDASFQERIVANQVDTTQMEEGEVDALRMQYAQEHSLIGRAGKLVEPVFRPLGYDWKTSVGVLTSFAAREVVVSTLSVLYGLGEEDEVATLREKLASAKRVDGTRVFNAPTCISLLVFFVLAMQCLPTQAVTKKETGSWRWAIFQFAYMSVLAYSVAFVAYRITAMLG